MMWFILTLLALSSPPPKPVPEPGGAPECIPVSIRAGYPIPEGLMLMGLAGCNGEVVPQSELVTLYKIEAWGDRLLAEYQLDIAALDAEIEFERARTTDVIPWGRRPEVQRWMGRADVIIPVIVAVAVAGVIVRLQ